MIRKAPNFDLKKLSNKKQFQEIIHIISSLCQNLSRTKNLKKSNNSAKKVEIEAIYRDTIALYLNSYPSMFEGLVSSESINVHGKTDIMIPFLKDNARYIAECTILKTESSIFARIKNKFEQLIYNITDKDTKISLIFFILDKIFEPNKIFNVVVQVFTENSFSKKIISKKEIYKNHDWIIKTKIEKFPEINFEIHVGIYHFYYDVDYAKNQK